MPPKKRSGPKKPVLTEEQQLAAFEEWKKGEEWKLIQHLYEVQQSLSMFDTIKGTENDMCSRIQPFLDEVPKIGETFKIKGAKMPKPILQEHIRVAFFCGYGGRNEQFYVDSVSYKFPCNAVSVEASGTQSAFMNLLRKIVAAFEANHKEYELARKEIIIEFTALVKSHKRFIKGKEKPFPIGKEYMSRMILPLQNLLNCNMGLTVIDFEYPNDVMYEVNNYRYLALITQFCEFYMIVQKIMYENPDIDSNKVVKKSLSANPDIYSILKKFQFLGWRENKVESYYIQPLLNTFLRLRANMTKLYLLGFNYWRLGLVQNEQLSKDMEDMIKCEFDAEPIMGNRLQREQLNFLFDQINIIFNSPGQKKLFDVDKKKSKMINLSIPQLVVLKSLERMMGIYNRKLKEQTNPEPYERLEIEPPKPLIEFALLNSNNKKVATWQDLLPQGMVYSETQEVANLGPVVVCINDNSLPELDKYGRFMIWYDFIPEDQRTPMIEASKVMRNINRAALQDLEDFIIAQGMQATRNDFLNQANAAQANKELLTMEEEEKRADVFKNRPPNIWNEPESLLMDHRFKYSAKPLEIYSDTRVHDLYDRIKDLAELLCTHKTAQWNNLVDKVIEVFKSMRTETPS